MKNATNRNLIIAIILLLLSSGALAYMVYQIWYEGTVLATQISALEEQSRQEASLLRLSRVAEETATERATLENYFLIRSSDSVDFLNEIETLAPSIGISLQTRSLDEVVAQDTKMIEVSFGAVGSRTDVQNFIQILEILPYVSKLVSVDLRSRADSLWEAEVVIQVQLLTYDE